MDSFSKDLFVFVSYPSGFFFCVSPLPFSLLQLDIVDRMARARLSGQTAMRALCVSRLAVRKSKRFEIDTTGAAFRLATVTPETSLGPHRLFLH
jgi:hypothetical protein